MEAVCHTSGEGGQLCREQRISMNPCLLFLSRAAINKLLHQKLESQIPPLKTWTVVTMVAMAVLDTVPLDKGESSEFMQSGTVSPERLRTLGT